MDLAYDTTSVSSYSKLLNQAKYGRNKNHENLPQINLALIYGQDSRLPVCYRKLPENISDVTTIRTLIFELDFLTSKRTKLVMDRGFFSEENLNRLYQHHFKFLIAVKISLKLVQNELDKVRELMLTRPHYSSKHQLSYYSIMIIWPYQEVKKRSGEVVFTEKRLYLHLFHNDQRATDDKTALNALLDQLEEELLSGKITPDHEKLYRKYYEINETPVRGIKLTPKQEAITAAEKNYGYFALLSNDIKDPLEALVFYRSKDIIEKAFGNLKERLNLRRTSVCSEKNLEGKLFVQFVALIYLAYIDKKMHEHSLYRHCTLQGLLDELDLIECFEHPGHQPHVGEITKKQAELYQLICVDAPA